MATLGLTKLGAINRMAWWTNQLSYAALDTGGTSDAGRAEEMLDQVTTEILTAGLEFNVERGKEYTPSGSPLKITLGTEVLAVWGSGRHAYRHFDALNGYVFDVDRYSNQFPDATTICLDVVHNASTWDDLPPTAKEYIAWTACRKWHQINNGDPQRDAWIIEHMLSAARAARPLTQLPGQSIATAQPFVPTGGKSQGQGQ
jgi:hypothetical protein